MQLSSNDHNNFPLEKFESMLKTNSVLFFDSDEFEVIVHHYLENGKMALAKKATKLGLEQHPASINLKLYRIEIYIFEDKLEVAESLLDELELLEPNNEEIYIQKANIYSRRNAHTEAIRLLEKALETTTNHADVYSLLGMEYLFMEDHGHAKHWFMRCLEEDEKDYSALFNIIYCFEYLEEHEAAIDYLNDFLNKDPYCEVAWHQVGKQYYKLKKYKKALAAYDFAIISDDRFIGAYLEKGRVLEKMKKYHEAIESYSITLGLDDPTSYALLRMGKCYEKLGNVEMALQFYTKCVEEDTLLDKGWIAITDFYIKNKQFQKALYYIEKAINIDAQNVHYWKRFAKINNKLDLYEEAEVGYRKTLELGNYELETWITRGDILINLGEFEAAVNNFNQALEFYSQNAELTYRLAGLHYTLGETAKGAFFLKDALKAEPEFSMIIEELFPQVFQMKAVVEIIKQHKNPSL
ncbi:tetratricopeptide repeat protein [Aequorivita marina]|uniref:tetratricopeptide repeat protein n=1 Tax=Aequorivita marina TaxID=3073654 RepID=UPI002875FC57|nr:tetratricopeptide repeat protein [Aequorivita sp. S2608]MDS1298074.1 tetratricopeptide repeat protein [Aequorivita sp. S2608]